VSTPPDYFTEIESHFAMRRGTPFILSAKDWALMQQWRAEGIPLPVVIEAIDRCFEKAAEGGRRKVISSLRYCRHAVREIWEERKELLVGSDGALPEIDLATQLLSLGSELNEAAAVQASVRDVILAAAEEIIAIRPTSVPLVEELLAAVEDRLFQRLREAIDPGELQMVLDEISRQLSGGAAKDQATLDRSREANLRRTLRNRLGLPRLSLFR
jgi:hypothetical protein